jgi:flagellar biosynthesis protein FlhG
VALSTTINGLRPAVRVAITSGKGGVGKTSVTINLATALTRLGHRVGVLDADFALGNVDILLGLTPTRHIGAVIAGQSTLDEVAVTAPGNFRVFPAASGVRNLTTLDAGQWTRLAAMLAEAATGRDFLLIDTATGVSDNVIHTIGLADYALVVTSYDPAALVDAYAVVKLVTGADRVKPIGVVVNGVHDPNEGDLVFRQLALAANRFLGRSLRYDGYILNDPQLREAGRHQTVVVGDGTAVSSRCFRRLARRVANWRPAVSGPWPMPPATAPVPFVPAADEESTEAPRCA